MGRPLLKPFLRIALTALVGLVCGYGLRGLGVPAPLYAGQFIWGLVAGCVIPATQTYLGTPRWFHKFIVLGLATLIGGSLSVEVLRQAIGWWPTVLAMIVATLIATVLGLAYLYGVLRVQAALAESPICFARGAGGYCSGGPRIYRSRLSGGLGAFMPCGNGVCFHAPTAGRCGRA